MAKKKKTAKKGVDNSVSFEVALESLEQIVVRLEDGNESLAESMAQYEQGVKYLKHCYGLLERAERKIEMLTGMDAQGRPLTEPFDDQSTAADPGRPAAGKRRARREDAASSDDSAAGAADMDLPGRLF